MKVDPLFDGWWTVRSPGWKGRCKHFCYQTEVVQIHAGDEWDIEHERGPWPTRERAESFQYRDMLEAYWEIDFAVYANHCLGCGRWAKVLAFDDAAGSAWRVTECARCDVIDSRDHSCFQDTIDPPQQQEK